ncbi:surface-associated interspersed protein (SURFIN), partial [Plasmodium relictum]
MNTEKKINIRKIRSASQYGHQYDTWKGQVISNFDHELHNIYIEGDHTEKRRKCRNFNNKVDDTKEEFMGVKSTTLNVNGDPEEAWNEIEQHIKTKIRQYSNLKCIRIPSIHPKDVRDKRNKIMYFCEDRDKRFYSLKMSKKKDDCLNYNQWINNEKNKFQTDNPWSISDSMGNNQAFKTSNNCTLINMDMFSNESCDKYNQIPQKTSSSQSRQRSGSPLITQKTPRSTATPIKITLPTATINPTTIFTPTPTTSTILTPTTTTKSVTIPKSTIAPPPTSPSTPPSTTTTISPSTPLSTTTTTSPSTTITTLASALKTIPTSTNATTSTTTPTPTSTPQPTPSTTATQATTTTSTNVSTTQNTSLLRSTIKPTTTSAPISTNTPALLTTKAITPTAPQATTSNHSSTTTPASIVTPPPTSITTQYNTSTTTPTTPPASTSTPKAAPTPSTTQATTPISTKVPITTPSKVSKVQNASSPPSTLKPKTISTTAPKTTPTSTAASTITPTSIPSTTLSTTFQNKSHGNISSSIPIKSSSTLTESTIISLSATLGPFLGIIILFIFVYRFTPIGSWIGNRRSKIKKTQRKKKQVQVDNESIFVGFSDKKSEINMKNFPTCNEKNSSTCKIVLENENNERNIETKSNIAERRKKLKWKAVIEVHMMVLEEFQKEEWELNRREFLKICLEEFKEGIYSDVINRHLIMEGDQEKIASIFLEQRPLWKIWMERNNKLIEKWKKEQWFKNLKKEWKKEVNKYITLIEKEEIMKNKKKGAINSMLEKQKIIWKKWIQKQNKLHTFDDEELLKQLLVEYETEEEMKKNVEAIYREKIRIDIEEKDKAFKDSNKNELLSRLKIEIHMMVLDECKKEEWIRNKKEFFKICIGELKLQDNSDEKELLEIEEEIMKSITLKKKKKELEKFKKEKCFIELKQEWMNNEKKYIEEVNKENLLGNNEERVENPMLQKQKIIWKKHWEEMHEKLKNENKNESFIKFMDEYNKKVIKKEADEINVVEKNIKEDEIEKEKKKEEYIQLEKKEETKMKHMERKVEEVRKRSNYMTLKKKPKRKTIIEIHMVIMQDCKQEEWELNRAEFLEICLNEWLKCEDLTEDVMD